MIIEQSLKMTPYPIQRDLWDLLEKYGLCRTPQSELLKQFDTTEIVEIPPTRFATHMNWMLKAILKASPATEHMELMFVDGHFLDVDVGLFGDEWKIHDKWLTWQGTHADSFCGTTSDEPETFTCDHAVLRVWDMMMTQLMASKKHSKIASQEGKLREMGRFRLPQMPRSVDCLQTGKRGQLQVTWISIDSHQNKDKPVKVFLHQHGCLLDDTIPGMYRQHYLCFVTSLMCSRSLVFLPQSDVASCQRRCDIQ